MERFRDVHRAHRVMGESDEDAEELDPVWERERSQGQLKVCGWRIGNVDLPFILT